MTAEEKPIDLFGNIKERGIGEEMKSSYIDYAMSVIVGRALPDVRDGLKPVHRRILYTMNEMGLKHNKAFKKSARVVGDVLGKYHPHGDASVYDALVRLVQDFSLRYPLVQGQGNFGSVDGDPAAAMRYTETRLASISEEMLADIDKDTVKFVPNYDGSLPEPFVMPARLPNLLANGSSGIAVGMATNIPPHNLGEVCRAVRAYIENPQITNREISRIMKGPDFPTGGIIMGKKGILDYFETGRGSVRIKARTDIEELRGNREAIIVTEIPYQVNKTTLIENIANLVREKKVPDISDIRDESDRRGMRLVIEVKRDGNAQVVLNQLFKHTQLQTTFGVIMLAIVEGKPRVMPIREVLGHYINHRKEVITRRTRFDLNKALAREHILAGLLIAIENMDEVVAIIRKSQNAAAAREKLVSKFRLSAIQAQAILDMRLHQLTQLESDAIEQERAELVKLIADLKDILANPARVLAIIGGELDELEKKYADKRRTEVTNDTSELSMEDLIPNEQVVVTMSHTGYIKRIPLNTYRAQNRGGKGIIGGETKEEDFIENLFVTSSHATILFFTTRGKVYSLKAYEIPEASRVSRGKAIVNLLEMSNEEKITSSIAIESFDEAKGAENYLAMCTKSGIVKRTALSAFKNIRRTGIAAITLEDGELMVQVLLTNGKSDIIIGTRDGKSIRFPETEVRNMGRQAMGVRGMKLNEGDYVVGMETVNPEDKDTTVLTVCENGHGKRTGLDEYREQHRGGSGIITIKTSERNGRVAGIKVVSAEEDLMVMTENGMMVRIRCSQIRAVGRNTQGVRLVRLEEGDKIASVAPVVSEDKEKSLDNETGPQLSAD
ncbi:MAG: DNA gyrase subunit A [Elusimicrobiaceae bacterium]|nr:DNA gyrase subunit A [Elusimicrobiaceae bacterium]